MEDNCTDACLLSCEELHFPHAATFLWGRAWPFFISLVITWLNKQLNEVQMLKRMETPSSMHGGIRTALSPHGMLERPSFPSSGISHTISPFYAFQKFAEPAHNKNPSPHCPVPKVGTGLLCWTKNVTAWSIKAYSFESLSECINTYSVSQHCLIGDSMLTVMLFKVWKNESL